MDSLHLSALLLKYFVCLLFESDTLWGENESTFCS